jgi:hypothetical protein
MIPVLTHHAQQSLNTVRGVYLLLDIFRKAGLAKVEDLVF